MSKGFINSLVLFVAVAQFATNSAYAQNNSGDPPDTDLIQQREEQVPIVDEGGQLPVEDRLDKVEASQAESDESLRAIEEKLNQLEGFTEESLSAANIWLRSLWIIVIIVVAFTLIVLFRRSSNDFLTTTLTTISKRLNEIEENQPTGLPPYVDEVEAIEITGVRSLVVSGRNFDATVIVELDGQNCQIDSVSYDKIRAQVPRSFANSPEYLPVVVSTQSGSAMERIQYPKALLQVTTAAPVAAGGWTRVEGTGFTPNTRVWVDKPTSSSNVDESAYVDGDTLIVDWPAGTSIEKTAITVRRDDGEEGSWKGVYP